MSLTKEELHLLGWRKASRSMGNGDCVEAAQANGQIIMRDSKDPDGSALRYAPSSWLRFVTDAKTGRYDILFLKD
jgi:Domain of unknown function (DUF397)